MTHVVCVDWVKSLLLRESTASKHASRSSNDLGKRHLRFRSVIEYNRRIIKGIYLVILNNNPELV